mmetsp:Transcript_8662/g.9561  ORF Transcript_8662/g.9561 Transcript_8662/m.9561 type:complete len:616 (+) Transcript_8662:152-1999(+)
MGRDDSEEITNRKFLEMVPTISSSKLLGKRSFLSTPLLNNLKDIPHLRIVFSLFGILGFPIILRGGISSSLSRFLQDLVNCWDGLLHVSNFLVLFVTLAVAVSCAHLLELDQRMPKGRRDDKKYILCTIGRWSITPKILGFFLVSFFSLLPTFGSVLQVVCPSLLWNPFLWGTYRVYLPHELYQATLGVCLGARSANNEPLCLSDENWNTLSSGSLSSRNPNDVEFVMKGIDYVMNKSGGIILNVMSRDTIESIIPLRENVEAFHRFVPNLSVVVFENDSVDGSREAFKNWSEDSTGYTVDLMECEEVFDCVFGQSHRYDSFEAKNFITSSSIGKMGTFRQRMVDYIVESPEYKDYTHMIVVDLDLGISLSPLGILHSLGKSTERPIASSARQPWPGSLGTLVPPYDFSAFRPIETKYNRKLLSLHEKYCDMMPLGHRWRNVCDAMSSMHLMLMLEADRSGKAFGNELHEVLSAYNGGTIYPIKKIREVQPQYDSGKDGQRCEHIGFNLGFQETMFVNPKWGMNIHPAKPGGPSGWRAMKNILKFLFNSTLTLMFTIQAVIPAAIFIFSVMVLGMDLLYPLFVRTMIVAVVKTTVTSHALPLPLAEKRYRQVKQI